jgi:DNA polymerase epsilon subunit 3
MDTDRPSDSAGPADKEKKEARDSVAVEDLNLPKSIITRLAKGVAPPNTVIQTNAVLAMSKSATVFINHLANAANEHTQNANKKTIMPQDVFAALDDIEFPFLRERLEAEFKKFNEIQTTKRTDYRKRVAAAKAGKSAPGADTSVLSTATTDTDSPAGPRSKKQKPNGPDDSQMDVDRPGDEFQDASDADTDPDQAHDEDEDDGEGAEEEEDEEEDEEDDDNAADETQDALEEREINDDDGDEALDDGGESD